MLYTVVLALSSSHCVIFNKSCAVTLLQPALLSIISHQLAALATSRVAGCPSECACLSSDQDLVLDILWHFVDNQATIIRHACKQVRVLTAPGQAIDTVLMIVITVDLAIYLLPARQRKHVPLGGMTLTPHLVTCPPAFEAYNPDVQISQLNR